MGAFLGCCVIAATIFYVGRKIARAVFAIGVMVENIGSRVTKDWPSDEEWRSKFDSK